ncbi:MAG: ferredoxin-NADP reductase, partial [Synechococcaceae bacterium WB4_1_0192]|nr:ferredoxin-NADP reductase [Synechococcaceae bacterium WB4_1_0192]
MRVSTATSGRSDSRVFTVVVQGYGTALPRQAERTINVPFCRL